MIRDLLFITAGVLVAIVSIVFSLTISKVILILTAAAGYWTIFWVRSLRSAWPTGIWVDGAGIRIGDVRALPFATSESRSVFTCSWGAVRDVVILDRPWRARAVLVIHTDRRAAGGPHAEAVENVFGSGAPPTTWTAYTRRPTALRAALARVPGGPPVYDHADPDTP